MVLIGLTAQIIPYILVMIFTMMFLHSFNQEAAGRYANELGQQEKTIEFDYVNKVQEASVHFNDVVQSPIEQPTGYPLKEIIPVNIKSIAFPTFSSTTRKGIFSNTSLRAPPFAPVIS
ncbi:hypothetical protein DMA11_05670 [Marinilabiliaceae bacterium JC017]|nr:hypothetical protein DMA11_05670 [Marinilabiliaceae bacterium JC017]